MRKLLFLCCFAVCMTACKKDKDTNPSSSAAFYFVGKLDGAVVKEELTATGDVELVTSNNGSLAAPDCTFEYATSIGSSANNAPYFEVSFPALFSGNCADEGTRFFGLFHTGSWTYGATTGKVAVHYFDGTEMWSSANGAQSDAMFNVTRSEKVTSFLGVSQTVGGIVTCQLYNSSGIVKKLEDASFVLNFAPWF